MKINPMLLADFYKLSHREMLPPGTETVYSTWTPRTSRVPGVDHVVVFGMRMFIQQFLIDYFYDEFFDKPVGTIVDDYKRVLKNTLGIAYPDTRHIEELHELGYLPIAINALPEGTLCPIRVPYMTMWNTDPRFPWLTNYIESLASCELWQAATSATIAWRYRRMLDKFAAETSDAPGFVDFQGHDFSFRGMSSLRSAMYSGMGHLLSFIGTDTIPAIQGAELYYDADIEKEVVGTSIPASEHSIQCAYADDMAYFRRLINEVHPSGFVSIVSDGYDFWDVIERVLCELKDEIMARDGKVVIRPDSGNPVKIVCGNSDSISISLPEGTPRSPEAKGAIRCLWEIFGGRFNSKGYRELNPHIGLIYGDAITFDRAEEICTLLKQNEFASTNIVFGIGSFTYQYNTRDTFGFALKTTLNVRDGKPILIYKDPKTDDGTKKSQQGRVVVFDTFSGLKVSDGYVDLIDLPHDQLKPLFRDGQFLRKDKWSDIRHRLQKSTAALEQTAKATAA